MSGCPNSTGSPSLTKILPTVPFSVEGTWFIVFIASTIIIVCPFFTFCPSSTNFFEPGSGDKYAVPTIGDVTFVPLVSTIVFFLLISADIIFELFIGSS